MIKNLNLIKKKIDGTNTIFFDLDGVLIDTEKLYFRFWKEACLFYGFTISDEDTLSLRSRDPNDAREFFKRIFDGKLDYDMTRSKRIELMNHYFETHPIELKECAVEILKSLKERGKKLYIVTANKVDKAVKIMDSLHIIEYFSEIISAKDVKRGKPFPDVYLKACEHVKMEPKDVVVFEDSPNGLKASHSAGCFTIMVEDLTPYTNDMDYVDGAISSLKEVL